MVKAAIAEKAADPPSSGVESIKSPDCQDEKPRFSLCNTFKQAWSGDGRSVASTYVCDIATSMWLS